MPVGGASGGGFIYCHMHEMHLSRYKCVIKGVWLVGGVSWVW